MNGVVTDENGNDVDLEYKRAVSMALSKIQHEDIELAILQSRNRGNGKGKLSPCHNVILGSRKGCIGFQKGIKGQFALICSYLNRKLLILN